MTTFHETAYSVIFGWGWNLAKTIRHIFYRNIPNSENWCIVLDVYKRQAMRLDLPARRDTLFEMREDLKNEIDGKDFPEPRIEKICHILMSFIRNETTTDRMMEYMVYGYENEPI